ncbi:hypothetical protein Tco_0714852 [Tanacetum coccineum]
MPQDQEENPSNDDEEPKEKVASKCDWFTKPTQAQDPTDPDWNVGKTAQQGPTQRPAFRLLKGIRTSYAELEYDVEEFDYFFNNDLKYLQGGVSTMTYTNSITKTKAAQYHLPGIEDMVPNIWVHVKVAYDKHALWGISH